MKTDLFAVLTTEPREPVQPFQPKAMPVILTAAEEVETSLNAPAAVAIAAQRSLPE